MYLKEPYRTTASEGPCSAKNAYPLGLRVISGQRYYSPELGRWTRRDPIQETGWQAWARFSVWTRSGAGAVYGPWETVLRRVIHTMRMGSSCDVDIQQARRLAEALSLVWWTTSIQNRDVLEGVWSESAQRHQANGVRRNALGSRLLRDTLEREWKELSARQRRLFSIALFMKTGMRMESALVGQDETLAYGFVANGMPTGLDALGLSEFCAPNGGGTMVPFSCLQNGCDLYWGAVGLMGICTPHDASFNCPAYCTCDPVDVEGPPGGVACSLRVWLLVLVLATALVNAKVSAQEKPR